MITGTTNWTDSGTFVFELNDATGVAGSSTAGWDLLSPTALTLSISTTDFNINIVSLTSGQVAGLANNFNSGSDYSWLFVDAGASITGFDAANFTLNTAGFQNSFGGTFSISQGLGVDDDKLFINYTAVPEPSVAGVIALGVAGMMLLRRRSQSSLV